MVLSVSCLLHALPESGFWLFVLFQAGLEPTCSSGWDCPCEYLPVFCCPKLRNSLWELGSLRWKWKLDFRFTESFGFVFFLIYYTIWFYSDWEAETNTRGKFIWGTWHKGFLGWDASPTTVIAANQVWSCSCRGEIAGSTNLRCQLRGILGLRADPPYKATSLQVCSVRNLLWLEILEWLCPVCRAEGGWMCQRFPQFQVFCKAWFDV